MTVTAVIEKNISFLASQMEAEGQIIDKQFEAPLPPVMVDSDLLYQAFLNILRSRSFCSVLVEHFCYDCGDRFGCVARHEE